MKTSSFGVCLILGVLALAIAPSARGASKIKIYSSFSFLVNDRFDTISGIKTDSTGAYNTAAKVSGTKVSIGDLISPVTRPGQSDRIVATANGVRVRKRGGRVYYTNNANLTTTASTCATLSNTNVSAGSFGSRWGHSAVSDTSGNVVYLWGGTNGSSYYNTGAKWDLVANTFSALSTTGAPAARKWHAASWNNSKMIVWGGYDGSSSLNSGGVYDPSGDSWSAVSTTNAPSARYKHTMVSVGGNKMVVYGGYDGGSYYNNAMEYNVYSDSWTNRGSYASTRMNHSAVFSSGANKMIVWGGENGSGATLTGAVLDMSSLTWNVTTNTGAPAARTLHNGIATNSNKMVVWGGKDGSSYYNTGGVYDITYDSWSATTTTGAPSARAEHAGAHVESSSNKMAVWGGWNGTTVTASGGVYNAQNDSWTSLPNSAPCNVAAYGNGTTLPSGSANSEFAVFGGALSGGSATNASALFIIP